MDGKTYERDAIERWFKDNSTSPMTRAEISKVLIPNESVRNMIQDWVQLLVPTPEDEPKADPAGGVQGVSKHAGAGAGAGVGVPIRDAFASRYQGRIRDFLGSEPRPIEGHRHKCRVTVEICRIKVGTMIPEDLEVEDTYEYERFLCRYSSKGNELEYNNDKELARKLGVDGSGIGWKLTDDAYSWMSEMSDGSIRNAASSASSLHGVVIARQFLHPDAIDCNTGAMNFDIIVAVRILNLEGNTTFVVLMKETDVAYDFPAPSPQGRGPATTATTPTRLWSFGDVYSASTKTWTNHKDVLAARVTAKPRRRIMSDKKKQELTADLSKLGSKEIEEAVAIIAKHERGALGRKSNGELDIDIQKLAMPTLVRLEKFVNARMAGAGAAGAGAAGAGAAGAGAAGAGAGI